MDDKAAFALANNAFVLDRERDVVYCPQAQELHLKSVKKDGRRRYIGKAACRECRKKCFPEGNSNPWKEIDFSPRVDVKYGKKRFYHKSCGMSLG